MMPDALIGSVEPPDLHMMTYNIRRRMATTPPRSPDLWARRKWLLRRLLAAEQPSLLGAQEVMPDQAQFVSESLGPSYRRIGHGRNADGGGEGCPIFFDSRRLEVLQWRQLALSSTPDVPGSKSWGNLVPRIVVSATFFDIATGTRFLLLNTHFDHLSRRSRLQSARMLAQLAQDSNIPVIAMGDTNTGVRSKPYRELTTMLQDSWAVALKRLTEPWGTYSHYNSPRRHSKRIDWLFVSPSIDVRATGINAVRYGGAAASDHEPVQAVLRLRATL
ncbi:MAG: endonuclease/exonuclease/phosphatase family protein [Homoserinimonas sp.]|nr:endonuclease/exonuclease/phosphatase family protein [Homoserinimonas sp.]